jgi:hypothetical protein
MNNELQKLFDVVLKETNNDIEAAFELFKDMKIKKEQEILNDSRADSINWIENSKNLGHIAPSNVLNHLFPADVRHVVETDSHLLTEDSGVNSFCEVSVYGEDPLQILKQHDHELISKLLYSYSGSYGKETEYVRYQSFNGLLFYSNRLINDTLSLKLDIRDKFYFYGNDLIILTNPLTAKSKVDFILKEGIRETIEKEVVYCDEVMIDDIFIFERRAFCLYSCKKEVHTVNSGLSREMKTLCPNNFLLFIKDYMIDREGSIADKIISTISILPNKKSQAYLLTIID